MIYSFISGSTGGIGKAFAFSCAKKGYNLFLTGRSELKLSILKEEVLKINPNISVVIKACQLADECDRQKLFEFIDQNNIRFNRIINVAGVDIQKAFDNYTREKLLFQLRVNVEATIDITHALLKRREGETEVVTISSMSGTSPMPYFAVYSASKALLINLFTSLHLEYKKQGVKITVVMPGGVPTREDIIKDIKGQGLWGKLSVQTPTQVAEKSLKAVRKNKIKYIPGFFNKLLNLIIKITPKKLVLSFIARRWKKQTKDAF
jgi:short-subunit dehydrogenase